MNKNKLIKFSVTLFALFILAINITPKLYAEEYFNYELQIPCAIDKTQIIIPQRFNSDYTGDYKVKCNSDAFFDNKTNIYHFKMNEGYYINLNIIYDQLNKSSNALEIENINLEFYKNTDATPCYISKLYSQNENQIFQGKISEMKKTEHISYLPGNMKEFISACGTNTNLLFKAKIILKNGKEIKGNNISDIFSFMIDEDIKILEEKNMQVTKNSKELTKNIASEEKVNKANIERITTEKITSNMKEISPQLKIQETNLFITGENFTKKIIPINEILIENKIKEEKIITEIILETQNENPVYVFEIKEKKKLLGFIPIGEKIVRKEISAIKTIKE